MAFLELHDIRKSYYLDKQAFPVLKGIDLQFSRGGVRFDPGRIRWGKIDLDEHHWRLGPEF